MTDKYNFSTAAAELLNPLEMVRERAIEFLANSRSLKALPLLKRTISTDNSVKVRFSAKKALHTLQMQLQTSNVPKNQASLAPGGELKIKIDLNTVESILAGSDLNRKQNLLILIANKQLVALLPVIISAAKTEENAIIRSNMVILMGMLGDKKDIKTIARYLKDKDPRVRANAIEALEFTGDPNAYPIVVNALCDPDNRIRANAIKALKNYGAVSSLALLKKMIKSDQVWMRESAAFALSIVAQEDALPLLISSLLDGTPSIRARAADGIKTLVKYNIPKAVTALSELNRSWKNKLLPPDPVDLMHLIENQPPKESESSSILKLGMEEKLTLMREIVAQHDKSRLVDIIALAQNEADEFIRANAIIALGQLGDETVIDILSDFLTSSKERIRANAIEALATIGGTRIPPLLISHLDDPNNRCRANAIIGLKEHPYFDIVKPLEGMVNSDVALMRRSALYAISDIGSQNLVPVLKVLCNDKDQAIKSSALDLMKIMASQGSKEASSIIMVKTPGSNDDQHMNPLCELDDGSEISVGGSGFLDFDSNIDFEKDFANLEDSDRPSEMSENRNETFKLYEDSEIDHGTSLPCPSNNEKPVKINVYAPPAEKAILPGTFSEKSNSEPSGKSDTEPPKGVCKYSIKRFFALSSSKKKTIIEELKNEINLQSYLFLREAMGDRDFEIKVLAKMALKNFDSDAFDFPEEAADLDNVISHSKPLVEMVEYSGYKNAVVLSRDLNEKAELFNTTRLWVGPFESKFPILNALREDTINMLSTVIKDDKIEKVTICFQQDRLNKFLEGKRTLDGNRYANVITLGPVINRLDPYSPTTSLLKELKRPTYLLTILTETKLILFLRGPLETSFAKALSVPYQIIEDIKIISTMDNLKTIVLHIYGDFVEIPELFSHNAKEIHQFINTKTMANLRQESKSGNLDTEEELKKLETLLQGGAITNDEYKLRKSKIQKILLTSGLWDAQTKK
jgi:HEAT repeat protein